MNMNANGRDLTQQLADAQRGIARQFLADTADDLNRATDAAHAAFREAIESDGSPESMLRVAEAAQAASALLSGIARDSAAQSTVVHSTPVREAARAIGMTPGAVNRWLEGEGRADVEWNNTHWWVNEKDLMQEPDDAPPAGDVTVSGDDAAGADDPDADPEDGAQAGVDAEAPAGE